MRVLIAEDDAVVRTVLRQLVQQLGAEPVVAANGDEAWALHQEQRCGAVISDWSMPGIDGLGLLQRIRQLDGENFYTYFILLTAHDAPEAVEQAIAAGVDDHLGKPVKKAELMARLSVASRIVALHQGIAERNRLLAEANRRMRRDLAAAASAQKGLLPTQLPELPGLAIGWRYQPCEECAGDLLGVQRVGDDRLALHLFDVSGHGVASALLAVQVARVLPGLVREDPRPMAVAEALNAIFYSAKSLRFLTLVYGLLDLRTHRLSLVSCAHPPPLVLRADGTLATEEVSAHPIGMFPAGQARFHAWEIDLGPGDRILFCSDGVHEAPGHDPLDPWAPFGHERLEATWREARAQPFEDSLTAVMDALAVWRGTGRIADDITLLGVERTR